MDLVPPGTGQWLSQIVADGADVFFNDQSPTWVWTADSAGGTPTLLAYGDVAAYGLAIDANNIYFGRMITQTTGEILGVPRTGGATTTLAKLTTAKPMRVAVHEGTLYFTGTDGQIGEVALDTSTAMTLADTDGAFAIAADGSFVYFTAPAGIRKIPASGGEVTTVATDDYGASDLALDETRVYWTNFTTGQVLSVELAGGSPTLISGEENSPSAIAIDDDNVYWVNYADPGEVRWASKSGGPAHTLASLQSSPSGISVDRGCVYWTQAGLGLVSKAPVP